MTRTVNPRWIAVAPSCIAGVAKANATSVTPNLGHVILEAIELIIPSGHVGLTGIGFDLASTRILPFGTSSDFFIGNNTTFTLGVGIEIDAGFAIRTYNLDAYTHGWIVNFQVSDIPTDNVNPVVTVIPIGSF